MTSSHDDTTKTLSDYHKALHAYREGDLDEAEQLCQKAMKSSPDYADVVHLLGIIEFKKGDDENAIRHFTQATRLNPNDAGAFVYLGASHHRTGYSSKAIAACHKAIALNPELADAHFQIGLVYQSQNELDMAETAYRCALNLDPDNARLYDVLGTILYTRGLFNEAITSYRKGLALNPKLASLHNNLGCALQDKGDLKAAEAAYLKALTLEPNYIKAQLGMARVHEKRKEYQQAVKAYQHAIRLDPQNQEAHANLGHILVDANKLDEARVCYENVLRIDSNDAEANEGLGAIYAGLDKFDRAIKYYRRASELGSISARHILAALTHEDTQQAPRQYVEDLFDSYSENFEEHLIETLSYETPKLLYEAFTRFNDGNDKMCFQHAIDLGCGTGLAGLAFQSIINQLDGVDLSPEMLKKASKKGIYNNLYTTDIVECLDAGGEKYDLFIAADVLVYIGNLTRLFLAVNKRASKGAYFLFSIESSDSKDFELQLTGRYAHSEAYIRSIAQAHKLTVLRCSSVQLRKENEEWVRGKLFILKTAADG